MIRVLFAMAASGNLPPETEPVLKIKQLSSVKLTTKPLLEAVEGEEQALGGLARQKKMVVLRVLVRADCCLPRRSGRACVRMVKVAMHRAKIRLPGF